MPKSTATSRTAPGLDDGNGAATGPATVADSDQDGDFVASAFTVGVVVAGAALIEAELIPGIIVGAAAMLAPKYLPKIGASFQPLVTGTIRGVYKAARKTREAFAEAQEHVHDIMAEVDAESAGAAVSPDPPSTRAGASRS
jgi:hypothetical protein